MFNKLKNISMKKHRNKIIAAAVVLMCLVAAFWWGGNMPDSQGFLPTETQTPAAVMENDMANTDDTANADEVTNGDDAVNTDEAVTDEASTEQSDGAANGEPSDVAVQTPVSESEKNDSTGVAAQNGTKTAKNEQKTAEKPSQTVEKVEKNTEKSSAVSDDATERTCTISVSCGTILNNISYLKEEKQGLIPSNGVVLSERKAAFNEGESVFNVLQRELKRAKIHLEFSSTPVYDSIYIEGINNIYEFDCGEGSGWVYRVNGIFPGYGCNQYKLKPGDKIEWLYTCNLGKDVGATVQ